MTMHLRNVANPLLQSLVDFVNTPGKRQSKTLILSTNVDQKSLETEFSIAICRQIVDKINGNRKHCFYRLLFRIRRLLRAFSIAAFPVWSMTKNSVHASEVRANLLI